MLFGIPRPDPARAKCPVSTLPGCKLTGRNPAAPVARGRITERPESTHCGHPLAGRESSQCLMTGWTKAEQPGFNGVEGAKGQLSITFSCVALAHGAAGRLFDP